jgi:hypothetical protein
MLSRRRLLQYIGLSVGGNGLGPGDEQRSRAAAGGQNISSRSDDPAVQRLRAVDIDDAIEPALTFAADRS